MTPLALWGLPPQSGVGDTDMHQKIIPTSPSRQRRDYPHDALARHYPREALVLRKSPKIPAQHTLRTIQRITMPYIFYYEKLEVWQLAIQLAKDIYLTTAAFPDNEKFGLISQLRRAAVSVSSNLAEGSYRLSKKDEIRFTSFAHSSLMEVSSQLTLSRELGFLNKNDLEKFRKKIESLAVKINKLRQSQISQIKKPEGLNKNMEEIPISERNSKSSYPSPSPVQTEGLNQSPKSYFTHETAVIDEGCEIGEGTKIWHFSHIMSGCRIGKNCNIGQNVVVSPEVILGNNVKVQNNVSIYTGVICEDDVFLGPSMVFTNVINPRSAVNRRGEYAKTIVKKGATIGANATIVCGIDIGEYAFIGAGAVVTKYVPAYALVVGNPARQSGWMSERGHRLTFDEHGEAICEESGEKYEIINGKVGKL